MSFFEDSSCIYDEQICRIADQNLEEIVRPKYPTLAEFNELKKTVQHLKNELDSLRKEIKHKKSKTKVT